MDREGEESYRAGSLVIGSLYWDARQGRDSWRRRYFGREDQPPAIPIAAPLRYGMFSQKRKCPTMVLSQEYQAQGRLGRALALPFREMFSPRDLIRAARDQSLAEGPADQSLIKGDNPDDPWCLLLAWINPGLEKDRRELFLEHWRAAYPRPLDSELLDHFKMESESQGLIGLDGTLNLPWPEELKDLDICFVTQTRPIRSNGQRNNYPDIEEMARETFARPEYFIRNRLTGLHTVDDGAVVEALWQMDRALFADNVRSDGCSAEQLRAFWKK